MDAALIDFARQFASGGRIVINANADDGAGTVTAVTLPGSSTFNLSFCPYGASTCLAVAQVVTGPQGHATQAFQFPQAGTWAGVFELDNAASTQTFFSGMLAGFGLAPWRSSLVRAVALTEPLAAFTVGADPLTSGSAVINTDGTMSFEVNGAAPSETYSVLQCVATPAARGTACTTVGSIRTDTTGFGTSAFFLQAVDPSVFVLTRLNEAEYVTGFVVAR